MQNELFVIGLGFVLGFFLCWGIRVLPGERWQVLAAVPSRKDASGRWIGVNFTYYGFFSAWAYAVSVLLYFIMLRSIGVSAGRTVAIMLLLLAFCVPASKIIARVVEKKTATFTVGGASFVGMLIGPWLVLGMNALQGAGEAVPVAPVLAAMAIAYALGEGVGRLACLSFGCCYGRAIGQGPGWLKRILHRYSCVFSGKSKKVAYESALDGVPLIPVQALTCFVNTAAALLGVYLFLLGHYQAACYVALAVTQLWRFYSETLRADFRGGKKISAYQVMGLGGMVYTMALFPLLAGKDAVAAADVLEGLAALWNPAVILILQLLWLAIFIFTGRSMVTSSTIAIQVVQERI